nr:hypothetical protein BaRGS_026727 [Batillaria attramentaria]
MSVCVCVLNIGGDNVLKYGPERFAGWRLDVEGTLPKALEKYVSDYVTLYYKDDNSLLADPEIQTWAQKLAQSRDQGGYGLRGLPLTGGKLTSRDDLVLVLTSAMFTSSAQHGALGSSQFDQIGYLPNYSSLLNGQPPRDKTPRQESDIVQQMPGRDVFLKGMGFISVLSLRAVPPLGAPLGSFIVDPAAVALGERFREDLRDIEKVMVAANRHRAVHYDYLYPSNIPNSIAH